MTTTDYVPPICSLCHEPMATGHCHHLIDLGGGLVAMSRADWESLVADRLRLRELEALENDGQEAP